MNKEILLKYAIGDFITEENGFLHACKRSKCKELFIGRKNRKYCGDICKNRVNNDKQSDRRNGTSEEIRQFERNQRILERLHNTNEHPTEIANKSLYQLGFKDDGIATLEKFKNFEGEWHGYGNYALQYINQKHSRILKIK
jgi:hypothetical protein